MSSCIATAQRLVESASYGSASFCPAVGAVQLRVSILPTRNRSFEVLDVEEVILVNPCGSL